MRIKPIIILAAVITAACLVTAAYGGNEEMKITAGEDWSWESGAVDLIEGEIDLSEYTGKELSVRISTDLPYESEEEAKARGPVFVSVNGKRITVKKQSDTARCTPSAEETAMRFTSKLAQGARAALRKFTDFPVRAPLSAILISEVTVSCST